MVSALAFGLATAVQWGIGSVVAAVCARQLVPWVVLFWASVIEVLACAILAVPSGPPSADAATWVFVALTGAAFASGKVLYLKAYEGGHISLVTPIIACDGSIAALLVLASGGSVSPALMPLLGIIVVATLMVATSRSAALSEDARHAPVALRPLPLTATLSIGAAVAFGSVFFFSGRATGMNPLWVVGLSQVVAAACGLFLCVRSGIGLRIGHGLRLVTALALLEGIGFATYIWGARADLIVAAIVTSQYAAIAAILGVIWSGERLSRVQVTALALLIGAAAGIAAAG